jgi:hypothetical protein
MLRVTPCGRSVACCLPPPSQPVHSQLVMKRASRHQTGEAWPRGSGSSHREPPPCTASPPCLLAPPIPPLPALPAALPAAKNHVPGKEKQSTKVSSCVLDLQRLLPRARFVYCSATGVSGAARVRLRVCA